MTFDPTSVEVTCVTVPKDHCVQVPWEYVNVCGYSYQFCKNYHIHTYTYILRTYYVHTTYYVQNQWSHSLFLNYVQARQQKPLGSMGLGRVNVKKYIDLWSRLLRQCYDSLKGSQLAKMKKSIPDMSLPWNLYGWSSWSKKLQIYLKNYEFCEYVEFGAISWKFNIFVNNCFIKVWIQKFFCTYNTYNCDYLQHTTFRFFSNDLKLNSDFPSQFYVFHRKIT